MSDEPNDTSADTTAGTTASVTSVSPRLGPALALVVVEGPDAGARMSLAWGTFTVGKSRSCDLVLTDPGVSRQHLAVERREGALELRDLGSSNGSYFDGARFERIEIGLGAEVKLGRSRLRVVPAAEEADDEGPDRFGRMIGASAAMRKVFAFLRRSAGSDLAGIAPTLIESELFGHAKGAFTGAERDRPGAFEAASGGTLLLDELGELPLEQQPRLLRAIEAGQTKRIGENHYRDVDVRVVAATNRDLAEEVKEGRFRADLYHRLAVLRVALPPLRDRLDDIPLLVNHFVQSLAPTASIRIPDDTMQALLRHDWPGNLRELRNVVERAIALADEDGTVPASVLGIDEEGPAVARPSGGANLALPFKEAKERLVDAWERDYVRQLLEACDGNVSLAARRAGMHRVHLHRLLKKYGSS